MLVHVSQDADQANLLVVILLPINIKLRSETSPQYIMLVDYYSIILTLHRIKLSQIILYH